MFLVSVIHTERECGTSVSGGRVGGRERGEFATSAAEEIYRLAPPALKHQEIRRVSLRADPETR